MADPRINYRPVTQDKGEMIRFGRSIDLDGSRREKVDARAEALNWFTGFINDLAFNQRIKSELKAIEPQIKAKIPPKGGVLVVIIYSQNLDFGYKTFDNLHIAAVGMDCKTVIKQYQQLDKVGNAPTYPFVMKEDYMWVDSI